MSLAWSPDASQFLSSVMLAKTFPAISRVRSLSDVSFIPTTTATIRFGLPESAGTMWTPVLFLFP